MSSDRDELNPVPESVKQTCAFIIAHVIKASAEQVSPQAILFGLYGEVCGWYARILTADDRAMHVGDLPPAVDTSHVGIA
jgi:hypothetical protein